MEHRRPSTGGAAQVGTLHAQFTYLSIFFLERLIEKSLHKEVNSFVQRISQQMGVHLFVLGSYKNEEGDAAHVR